MSLGITMNIKLKQKRAFSNTFSKTYNTLVPQKLLLQITLQTASVILF